VLAAAFCLLAGARPGAASASTDPATFFTAIDGLPGSPSTLDFEGLAAGTTIPSGGSIAAITFSSSIGLDMIVSTGFDGSFALEGTCWVHSLTHFTQR
jgi:hypothetical protein